MMLAAGTASVEGRAMRLVEGPGRPHRILVESPVKAHFFFMDDKFVRVLGPPEPERGFTLIELMIVSVIVGLLAGIAGLVTRDLQVKAHLTSVVADGRILYHGLEEFYAINYMYPNATSNPAFNLVTFEPLRSMVGYQGSINSRLLNGQADSYDSPDDRGPNQEWWVQMTLLIDPSFQVVIAASDNVDLLPGTWMEGVYTFEDGNLIAGPGVP